MNLPKTKKGSTLIMLGEHPASTKAEYRPTDIDRLFGIHKGIGGWRVTHSPSGLGMLTHQDTRKACRAYADAMVRMSELAVFGATLARPDPGNGCRWEAVLRAHAVAKVYAQDTSKNWSTAHPPEELEREFLESEGAIG